MANKYLKFIEKFNGFLYGIVLGTIGISLFNKPAMVTSIMGLISAIILTAEELARKSNSN